MKKRVGFARIAENRYIAPVLYLAFVEDVYLYRLSKILSKGFSSIHPHLTALEEEGLVSKKKRGKKEVYSFNFANDPILDHLQKHIKEKPNTPNIDDETLRESIADILGIQVIQDLLKGLLIRNIPSVGELWLNYLAGPEGLSREETIKRVTSSQRYQDQPEEYKTRIVENLKKSNPREQRKKLVKSLVEAGVHGPTGWERIQRLYVWVFDWQLKDQDPEDLRDYLKEHQDSMNVDVGEIDELCNYPKMFRLKPGVTFRYLKELHHPSHPEFEKYRRYGQLPSK